MLRSISRKGTILPKQLGCCSLRLRCPSACLSHSVLSTHRQFSAVPSSSQSSDGSSSDNRLRDIEHLSRQTLLKVESFEPVLTKLEKKSRGGRWKYVLGALYVAPFVLIWGWVATVMMKNKREKSLDRECYKVLSVRSSDIVSGSVGLSLLSDNVYSVSFTNLIKTLRYACDDDTVCGIALELDGAEFNLGLAKTEELIEELRRFKERGKFIMAYGKHISMKDYCLGTVADEIHLQPSGIVSMCGFSLSTLFFKGLLDKIGIEPVIFKREDYKCAMNSATETELTAPHREQLESLGQSLYDQMLQLIVSSGVVRKAAANTSEDSEEESTDTGSVVQLATTEDVKKLIDSAPLTAAEAAEKGVVVSTLQRKEFELRMAAYCHGDFDNEEEEDRDQYEDDGDDDFDGEGKSGKMFKRVPRSEDILLMAPKEYAAVVKADVGQSDVVSEALDTMQERSRRYLPRDDAFEDEEKEKKEDGKGKQKNKKSVDRKRVIALVNINGQITAGESDGVENAGADSIEKLLHKVASDFGDDSKQKAVGLVLRIDSPGGDAIASETIWNAVMQLRHKTRMPVVVSMGDVCASGGYYIASAADAIVALPATITGSIGVLMASMNASAAMEKAGVTHDSVKFGANSELLYPFEAPSEAKLERLNALIDHMYGVFLKRVSEGRGMDESAVREVAQGRVWTGAQAIDKGLIDELGGLYEAKRICQEMAGVPLTEDIELKQYSSKMEQIFDLLDEYGAFTLSTTLRAMLAMSLRMSSFQKALANCQQTKAYYLFDPINC